jgi:membrane associated rhomboid family serine protease
MPNGPTTLSLPSFSGATRRLVLINVVVFFIVAIFGVTAPAVAAGLFAHVALTPALLLRGELWQLLSYSFLNIGLLAAAFNILALWFVGAWLEGTFGARWMYEFYFATAIGAGVLAAALSFTHLLGLTPYATAVGMTAPLFALFTALGIVFGDQEIIFMFTIRMKARYMAALYIVLYLAILVVSPAQRFDALVGLCGAFCGFLFLRLVPRRGLGYGVTERLYAARNEFYRNKRRRAARKFEVYMSKQGRDVHFDKDGKYVDPDEQRDPTDKRWMN